MFSWNDLKTEIIEDYDLQEQGWINEQTLRRFANSAITEAELEIQLRKDRYFKRNATINLVANQSEYSLPSDCFEGKLTGIFFMGASKYKLTKIKHDEEMIDVGSSDDFKYDLYKTATGYKLNLYPTPAQDLIAGLKLFYIAKAARIVNDSSIVDLPEAARNFIKIRVMDFAANKERMNPNAAMSDGAAKALSDMIETLATIQADDNNVLEADYSAYEEQV